MGRGGYSTDLSDAQWMLIEPHLPLPRPSGRRRTVSLRGVIVVVLSALAL